MVILKKVKASTLMETLVATVLIVVIFMLASVILNNLFSNIIKSNTAYIDNYLSELEYLYLNEKIEVPFFDDFKTWEITIQSDNQVEQQQMLLEAINSTTKQMITKHLSEE